MKKESKICIFLILCSVAILSIGVVIVEHADEGRFYFVDEEARRTTGISLTSAGVILLLLSGFILYKGWSNLVDYMSPHRNRHHRALDPGYHDILGTRRIRRGAIRPKIRHTRTTF